MKINPVILIPSRYASTRLVGKPLQMILGKSMIERVYTNCLTSSFETYVVTDDDKISSHVEGFGGKVLRVDDSVSTGTQRIYLAYERYLSKRGFDFIINVQGDEPLIQGLEIVRLAEFHASSHYDIASIVKKKIGMNADFLNFNKVKAIFSEKTSECFYFSRASIPFLRERTPELEKSFLWYLHIGVYSYKPDVLKNFCQMSNSYLEEAEKLEQLRALEFGMHIGAMTTDLDSVGVDTYEDLKVVEEILCGKKY